MLFKNINLGLGLNKWEKWTLYVEGHLNQDETKKKYDATTEGSQTPPQWAKTYRKIGGPIVGLAHLSQTCAWTFRHPYPQGKNIPFFLKKNGPVL